MSDSVNAADFEIETLLARSAKLRFYLMLRRTIDAGRLRAMLGDHLRWIIAEEGAGRIFLSGPVATEQGGVALDGLTILRAASRIEAERIAAEDPFVRSGAVVFEIREWTVNEGSIPLTIRLSDSSVRFR